MITCFIIDDEQPAINVLRRLIGLLPNLHLIGTATNPVEGLQQVEEKSPDLLFLDIEMAVMDGIELARLLDPKTKIIFCTAYADYAVQSYEVNAVDYLLKPIEFPRFKIAVQKFKDLQSGQTTPVEEIKDDYILVKQAEKGKLIKIDLDEIVAVKACKNYMQFYYQLHKLMVYVSLKELEQRLPLNNFFRVHKSYIISLRHIKMVQGNHISMNGIQESIPIGDNYKANFLERIKTKVVN